MKVRKLIELLEGYDGDSEVFVNIGGEEYFSTEFMNMCCTEDGHVPVIYCAL